MSSHYSPKINGNTLTDPMLQNGSTDTNNSKMSIMSMLSSSSDSRNILNPVAQQEQEQQVSNGGEKNEIDLQQLYTAFQDRINNLVDLDSVQLNKINRLKFFNEELQLLNPNNVSLNKLMLDPEIVANLKKQLFDADAHLMDLLIEREKLMKEAILNNNDDSLARLQLQQHKGNNIKVETDSHPSKELEYTITHNGRVVRKPLSYEELTYEAPKRRRTTTSTTIDDDSTDQRRKRSRRGGSVKHQEESNITHQRRPSRSSRRKPEEYEKVDDFADPSKLLSFKVPVPLPQPKRLAKEQRAIEKQYDNVYLSIWKDLSRKDGPRVYRLLQQAQQTRLLNLKKTAMLAARESKRWQLRTNKSQKDVQSKARRSMREMFNFWKKNEREERDLRKKAEKEALDKSKKEEEEREAKRQSRKLNFLITQTELYSHFISKKVKTDELEGNMGDKSLQSSSELNHSQDEVDIAHANKDFGSIDFDLDEETLRRTAAANAQNALLSAQQTAQLFNDAKDVNADDEDEMNFQNPTSLGDINIEQPKLLTCTLKEYQVKGLNWLANLYDQGINGILADEMGLGKTVQSISVLAYLAETQNIWGPFLVVTPASTLHNWQQEISKFVPDFKVLPYWGSAKDRKVLRKFWDRKKITYDKSSPFHVVVTSYQLVVSDAQYFQRMRWQYMILDEAQAIKSSQSSRWKVLLSFQCRNRLLLTGTPIQNSMQELWALLHFIMPTLFDSHDEFSEWFSKDIESHAQSNTQLNEQQLKRLHVILKPFMLRRIKKNVQSELGDKIEIDLYCDLTNRQKKLYQMVKSQISLMDLMDKLRGETSRKNDDDENTESLLNLVMQFRKVCNHPDLFERADTKSAFAFNQFAETASFLREKNDVDLIYSSRNEIDFKLPKLIYDELLLPNYNNDIVDKTFIANNKINIWSPKHIKENQEENQLFTWLRFIDQTANEINKNARNTLLDNAIELRTYNDKSYKGDVLERFNTVYENGEYMTPTNKLFLINQSRCVNKVETNMEGELKELFTVRDLTYKDMYLNVLERALFETTLAPPIELECSTQNFAINKQNSLFDQKIRTALMPLSLNTEYELMTNKIPIDQFPKAQMLPAPLNSKVGFSTIHLPSMKRFVIESGKLNTLNTLLHELKKGDHKVLIYFQMTRMMDLMEEYLKYKQYKYIRLDGSSKLSDRRDLVHDWQTKPELFIFLLSTRAGGLGINLTAADTVVFYDSDWNPTIDSQAMDRAHRLGQTRQVTVYRLLVRGTIEERMRDRAKQKEHVQQVVMEGKASTVEDSKKTNSATEKKKEVAMLLLDD